MADELKIRVQEDMKDAMRKKESLRLSTIRLLMAAIKQREIDERITLDDANVIKVIHKMIKQRKESSEQFSQAGRTELADKEDQEITILEVYLPEQLSESDIETMVKKAIKEAGAISIKDMGKVMGTLKSQLEGRADMRVVSEKIKSLLT